MNSIYKISLDFYNKNIVSINAKQLDTNSRYIEVTCTDRGKKIVLDPTSVTAIIRYKKPDGYYCFNNAVEITESGTAIFELTQQMLAVSGKNIADIMIVNATGLNVENISEIQSFNDLGTSIISTMSFYINTDKTAIEYGDVEAVLESSYEYNALTNMVATNAAIEKHMEDLATEIEDAETARVEAENSRIVAEEKRNEKEVERQNNESDRKTNEELRVSNENARKETMDTYIEQMESATSACTTITDTATSKITTMESLLTDLSQTIHKVINDDISTNYTTYSSEKIDNVISNFSNPNLLINGEFKIWNNGPFSEVNPGSSSNSINKWTIKNASNHSLYISKNDSGGILISYTNTDLGGFMGTVHLCQRLEDNFYEAYAGMNYAFSFYINNEMKVVTGKIPSIDASDDEKNIINISITPILTSIDEETGDYYYEDSVIDYAKLEIGTMATPFMPRTYDEDLKQCKTMILKAGRLYPAVWKYVERYYDSAFEDYTKSYFLYFDLPLVCNNSTFDYEKCTILPNGRLYDGSSYYINVHSKQATTEKITNENGEIIGEKLVATSIEFSITNYSITEEGQLLIEFYDDSATVNTNNFSGVSFDVDWYIDTSTY